MLKKYVSKFEEDVDESTELKEETGEEKAKSAINLLIDSNWSGSNAEQGKAVQTFKYLAFSDSPLANKFMKKIDTYTNSLKKDFK